jgi:hypothetical protein
MTGGHIPAVWIQDLFEEDRSIVPGGLDEISRTGTLFLVKLLSIISGASFAVLCSFIFFHGQTDRP